MADQSINLLQPEEIGSKEKKIGTLLKTGTVFLIVFYCLLVIALFSFGLVVQKEYQSVKGKVDLQKSKLASLQSVEASQFFLKQRLSSLIKIVKTDRPMPAEWLGYLDDLTNEGLSFKEVKWDPRGKISLSGMAGNALYFADFLEALKKAVRDKKITNSVLNTTTRHKEGTYSFSLEIAIKEIDEKR